MDLTMATTDELLVQAKEIEAELLKRLDEELAKLDARRAELLAMKPPAKTEEKKKRVKSSRPAKFRNPGNPEQTWTGRGKAPAWVDVVGREACLIPVEG
ncbi:MAG: H-NS histone family protein [Vampirovibrionales bacterium]|nr:H-NS histone family protein [Vampirovibrionales bacterium]MBK8191650.1 H-NS histone family protein [Vampirovibrionales bacterium]